MDMDDINLVPIFDQSKNGIWGDFLRIRDEATYSVCGYSMSSYDYDNGMKEYEYAWKNRSFNFSFGAYDNDKMVGFIQGDCINNISSIRCLYVLPDYMNRKIGSRLLRMAEKVSVFGAKTLDLISLPSAQKFYERYEYVALPIMQFSNHYRKQITNKIKPTNSVVPVFKVTKEINKVCSNILKRYDKEFDVSIANIKHLPMFVYVDAFSGIQAIAFINSDTGIDCEKYVSSHQPEKYITSRLDKEFEKLNNINSCIIKCADKIR